MQSWTGCFSAGNRLVPNVLCLMGPTASGKTDVAVRLRAALPLEIISVDSAMVYRGMDIGTAKPDAETLRIAPHRLIDIREPEETYSAGDFVRDARREIDDILSAGRVPLLVGGTMMYFRALIEGIASLPAADAQIRADIDREADESGWPALHARLAGVDPAAARRIEPNDSQRIQRALEVYRVSGKPLSEWQKESNSTRRAPYSYQKIGLVPGDRPTLHARIAERVRLMMDGGLVDEVRQLLQRPNLTLDSTAMRSVGYRQIGQALLDGTDLEDAAQKALYATRQLAKRQYTWLRSEAGLQVFDPLEVADSAAISSFIRDQITE